MPLRSRSSKARAAAKEKAKKELAAASSGDGADAADGGGGGGGGSAGEAGRAGDERKIFAKLFDRTHELTSEEALLAAHWVRQMLAIGTGVLFGLLRLTGSSPLLTHVLISFTSPTSFISLFHEIDIDEIAKVGVIQTEGFMPAFALFLLTWIITYTIQLPPAAA